MMIATVWVLAFAVSCPLLFGFNTTGEVNNIDASSQRVKCTMSFRIQAACRLGSAVGHEIQSKMGFKGTLHQNSMSESIFWS